MSVTAKTRFQSRLNSIVMFFLLIIALALLAWLSQKYAVEYDLTANGRHTLSTASRELVKQMPEPIEVISYARKEPILRDAVKKLVGKYQRHKANINLRFVNPDANPDEMRNLGISVDGEMIIHYQNKSEHVRQGQEQAFTNALQRLARNKERWIAVIEGHGERSVVRKANHDISVWVNQLLKQGYKVQPINLNKTQTIPDNTSILIIAGPRVDFLPGELETIKTYIKKGGNLLWLHDPGSLYKLKPLANQLSIKFYPGFIVDYEAASRTGINDPTISLVNSDSYSPHPITNGFEFTTLFPMAGAIEILKSDKWTSAPILKSGNQTWNETNDKTNVVKFNKDSDILGPLNIGVALERAVETEENSEIITKQQRIVVIADGDFLSNTYIGNGGNNELGTRMINWLSSDDQFISIPPKVASDTQLEMSPTLLGIIGIGFLFILPAILIAIGITIGIRRKKQ